MKLKTLVLLLFPLISACTAVRHPGVLCGLVQTADPIYKPDAYTSITHSFSSSSATVRLFFQYDHINGFNWESKSMAFISRQSESYSLGLLENGEINGKWQQVKNSLDFRVNPQKGDIVGSVFKRTGYGGTSRPFGTRYTLTGSASSLQEHLHRPAMLWTVPQPYPFTQPEPLTLAHAHISSTAAVSRPRGWERVPAQRSHLMISTRLGDQAQVLLDPEGAVIAWELLLPFRRQVWRVDVGPAGAFHVSGWVQRDDGRELMPGLRYAPPYQTARAYEGIRHADGRIAYYDTGVDVGTLSDADRAAIKDWLEPVLPE